ncbi:MAG: alpha/beta fold hydrolase, partial [Planctomycetota bacterium]
MTAVWHGVIALTSVAMLAHSEPSLVVDSATELRGDPVTIRVVGAEPGAPITLTAERIYGRRDPSLRRAAATFEADAHGVVDVATMAPTAGSYRSVDRSGLFWSMRPTDTELPDWGTSTVIHISVDLDADGAADLRDTVTLRPSIDGLERIPIGDEHPAAFLMRPPSVERPPVVIVMGGSEGHDSTARSIAPKLASRGFAVVGLPYYSPAWGSQPQRIPGLPRAFHNIDLSRVESIRDWIRAQDDLDGERIGLWGVSKGGEMALAAASRIDGFSSVVAIVPSDVIWEGWGSGTTEGESSCF